MFYRATNQRCCCRTAIIRAGSGMAPRWEDIPQDMVRDRQLVYCTSGTVVRQQNHSLVDYGSMTTRGQHPAHFLGTVIGVLIGLCHTLGRASKDACCVNMTRICSLWLKGGLQTRKQTPRHGKVWPVGMLFCWTNGAARAKLS